MGSCKSVTVPETLCPLEKVKNAKMCSLSSLAPENTHPKRTKKKTLLQDLNVESKSKNLAICCGLLRFVHLNNWQKLMTKH